MLKTILSSSLPRTVKIQRNTTINSKTRTSLRFVVLFCPMRLSYTFKKNWRAMVSERLSQCWLMQQSSASARDNFSHRQPCHSDVVRCSLQSFASRRACRQTTARAIADASSASGVARNVNSASRFSSLFLTYPLFPFLFSPSFFLFLSLKSRTSKFQLEGLRERCELPSGVRSGALAEFEFGAL